MLMLMAIEVLENYVNSYTGVPYCQQNASEVMIDDAEVKT